MPYALSFAEERNGFNKAQVNAYLDRIFNEYEHMSREYKALEKRYSQLEQTQASLEHDKQAAVSLASNFQMNVSQLEGEIARLKTQPNDRPPEYTQEVARVLIDAEVLAQQIIDRAHEEENRLNSSARTENERLTALRYQLSRELKMLWERLRQNIPQ